VARGNVKSFSDAKGCGVIAGEDGVEVFVHYSSIWGEGFRTLAAGERVEFDVAHGPRGPQATNVRRG
jgi:CspA family cold shock protein